MTIHVSDKVTDLTEHGAEYLTDRHGNVLAEFYDGNLVASAVQVNPNESTKGV